MWQVKMRFWNECVRTLVMVFSPIIGLSGKGQGIDYLLDRTYDPMSTLSVEPDNDSLRFFFYTPGINTHKILLI